MGVVELCLIYKPGHLIVTKRFTGSSTMMLCLLPIVTTIAHYASDIIKYVKAIFEALYAQLLDTMCDANTEEKLMSDFCMALEKECHLTRSNATKLPIKI